MRILDNSGYPAEMLVSRYRHASLDIRGPSLVGYQTPKQLSSSSSARVFVAEG